MVRLIAVRASLKHHGKQFQFQYGAVDSDYQRTFATFEHLFQFQYGAVDRVRGNFKKLCLELFQFQYGAVDSLEIWPDSGSKYHFNSSMVRLIANTPTLSDATGTKFQFQYGAVDRITGR